MRMIRSQLAACWYGCSDAVNPTLDTEHTHETAREGFTWMEQLYFLLRRHFLENDNSLHFKTSGKI